MSLFSTPPLPQQRRRSPVFGATAATSAVGSASFTITGTASSAIGAGAAALSVTGIAAAQWSVAAAGSASLAFAGSATSTNIFPLAVSADSRTFQQADGTPFLICADTTWSLFVDIPLAGVASFLNTITGQGFNAVMGNAIEHHYTVVKPPAERTGLLPFTQRMNGTSYTGSPNGTTGAAGTQGQFAGDNYSSISTQAPDCTFINNSYWQNVEAILDACLARNVLVFVWPQYLGFHGNDEGWLSEIVVWDAVTGAGGFTGQSFADPSKSKMFNYGAWLAARWKSYPNIIWVMGGDYGSGGQSLDAAQRAAVQNCMLGIKSIAGAASTKFTAHWDRPCISDDTSNTAGNFSQNWDLNFAYADDSTAELTRRGYAASPTKPCILGEYFYEAGLFGGSAPYRRYLWWGVLGGIAGTFVGHEQLWRFDDGTPGTDYTTLLTTTGTLDASRLFAFMKSKPWWRLKPSGLGGMGTLVTVGGGTASPQSTTYVAAACTPEGDLLLAYVPPAHTGSITIDMTKMAATARARWFDPTNASFTDIGAFANTGTRAFTPPATNSAGDPDFLLVLETVAGTASFALTAAAVGAAIVQVPGSATLTIAGQGVGQSQAQAAGSASLTLAAAGVSGTVIQGVGSSSFGVTATATGARTITAAGSATISAAAAATSSAIATTTGTATASFSAVAEGSSIGTGPATGTASFTTTATAVSTAIAAAAGAATMTFAAAAVSAGTGTAVPTSFAQLVADMDRLVISILG